MAEETKKAEQAETPETEKETVAKETQVQEQTVEETPAKAEEKKEKKKSKKKDKKDEKIEELNDRLLRNMAEFENFRNRSEKEKAAKFDMGAKNVVEKVLPIVDNFERGLAAVPEEEKGNAFVKGMEAVYKQFTTVLEEIGVTPIEAVGKEFDPNLHNAVMHVEDENVGENIIVEVFQKGYTYRDGVVRHSMVKVAN